MRASTGRPRWPLASIEATIEAVSDGILPADQSTLDTLTNSRKRLYRLVGDLSAVSRGGAPAEPEPVLVPLQDVVSAAVAAARPGFDAKGITLTEDGASPWPVLLDADRLGEAQAIVKAHGGQLHAHTDGPGQGAQFEITLPVTGRSR